MITEFTFEGCHVVPAVPGSGRVFVAAEPDEYERAMLQEEFRLDDYDLASTLDPDEVPRLDIVGERLLLLWKVPESAVIRESIELGVNVVGIVLVKDRLAFVRGEGGVNFRERVYSDVHDSIDVVLAFLLGTVRQFVGHLKAIRQISAGLERKITVSMENRHLLQMFSLSESLVYYLDAIEGNASVLSKLRLLAAQNGFSQSQIEMLDDVILENGQAGRQANIFSSVLSGMMDARGTIVNNNMNVLLKNLTLINIVFLPLNLIASIGGMSEWSMMTSGIPWGYSYAAFCVAMIVMGAAMWIVMKRTTDRPGGAAGRGNGTMLWRRTSR